MNYLNKLIGDIETHDVNGIKDCFLNGIDPNDHFREEPLINELTSEYGRTPRFSECVQAFVEHGLVIEDKALLAVLLNSPDLLTKECIASPDTVFKRYTLRCAYTPLVEVTLLHICAEFNHVACAEILCSRGADINARAGLDAFGFGGQTPIFHTVNQNSNNSADMMQFLLNRSSDLFVTVRGLIWGKGYPWETFIPAVNPISYATVGLLPQMHRNEKVIADVTAVLLKAAYGITYIPTNIPNAYLQ